jgi:Methyltransferase domain
MRRSPDSRAEPKKEYPTIDIVVDDGGHQPEQQIPTLEEMLPHLRPGGVYLCEDVHGEFNPFASYVQGLIANVNYTVSQLGEEHTEHAFTSNEFQAAVQSIHFYPFMTVIEKADWPIRRFVAPQRGTEWQPFLRSPASGHP